MEEQLALIYQDEINRRPLSIIYDTIPNVYLRLESETERAEEMGLMWVDEHKIDTHTLVRNFATKEDGLVASLIVVGGVACDIKPVNKH
jgi:hypothetical protein